jgi:hypothetical protein
MCKGYPLRVTCSQIQWLTSVIPATEEVAIRKIKVWGQTRQKVSETPISTNKPGVVAHILNSNYEGGQQSKTSPGKKIQDPKYYQKKKRLTVGIWYIMKDSKELSIKIVVSIYTSISTTSKTLLCNGKGIIFF